jgi:hypothetical protein
MEIIPLDAESINIADPIEFDNARVCNLVEEAQQ